MERPAVYCQNCRSQNSLRDTHCVNCGTRLLLVVFPQSLQYDTNHVPSYYEDHLLERVSLLELRLGQMTEAMKIAMEIIREQGKMVKETHHQIKKLGNYAKEIEERQKVPVKAEKTDKASQIIESIITEHDSPNVELFSKLLSEGVRLLAKSDEKEAFRMLERAALLSPRNVSLLGFVARNYYFADKFAEAKKFLEKSFDLSPDITDVLLLLGTIYADEADCEKARLYLSIPAEDEKTALTANFIWGMMAASEGNWSESVAAFKVAAEIADSPELQYLTGCAFFEMEENVSALEHLQRAISLDRKFSDAWFMQAVVYRKQGDGEREKNMLQNASELKEAGAQCAEYLRKNKTDLPAALPFRHFSKKNARLLTGGALRLARFLKNEIGKAIE